MTNIGWAAIGEIARKRRERLGLNQDELARYGGPKVATVGKFERAAQESFPLRTQHQIETSLGWGRGVIEQVVSSLNEGRLNQEDWEHDLVEEDIPDLSQPAATVHDLPLPDVSADARRLALGTIVDLIPEERRDEATRAAIRTLLGFTDEAMAAEPTPYVPDLLAVANEGVIEDVDPEFP